ncbi:menaquinone-dependent protoporphyrinogen IX dehydrogenase [Paraferrimonas sp. SM1919]|uniref:menaquinone-dependent protoporphyrinogen IX dehydrogenase n=1 Tax=Paraferrimonas sp. SM1919 TaxID=2662263 RepID=UPI0013D738CE|nr:menaquinone-dependent protoporphyrinogen IX dehydrogenase [Paraferrimonas sp. SM1919]
MNSMLILYSTIDGHTKTIISHMCEQLQPQLQPTVMPLEQLASVDLNQFDTIVVGASIRYGKFRPNVMAFFEQHKTLLDNKKVSFFGVNMVARKANKNTPETNPYLKKFKAVCPAKVDLYGVMAGRIDYPDYRLFDRLMIQFIMKLTKGPTDATKRYEFTDWQQVQSFTQQLLALHKSADA